MPCGTGAQNGQHHHEREDRLAVPVLRAVEGQVNERSKEHWNQQQAERVSGLDHEGRAQNRESEHEQIEAPGRALHQRPGGAPPRQKVRAELEQLRPRANPEIWRSEEPDGQRSPRLRLHPLDRHLAKRGVTVGWISAELRYLPCLLR